MRVNVRVAWKWVAAAVAGLSIVWASGVTANAPLSVMLDQATTLHRGGEYVQAMAIYERVLESPEFSDAELRAYVLSRMADVNIELGRYGDAVTKSREAIVLLREAQKEHTGTFAVAERVLADGLYAQGYEEQAGEIARQALSLGRQTLDTQSPELAFVLVTLAQVQKKLGKLGEAERLCQSALQILQRSEAAQKVDLARAYQNVANIQVLRGRAREAATNIDLSLAVWSQVPPPQHPSMVFALVTKTTVCARLKAFRQGEELTPRVLALGESLLGHNHPERVILLNEVAAFYVAEKKYGDAEPLLREAAGIAQHQLAAGHPITRTTLLNYAYVLTRLNRKDDAARVRAESDVVRAAPSRGAKNTIKSDAADERR
jgi:tetratricopeptide (TPR) repeat protein